MTKQDSGRRLLWLMLALAAPLAARADEFTAAPLAVAPRDLRELLATVDGDRLLRVSLDARETIEGYPHLVVADTLLLTPREGTVMLRAPLMDIVNVQQRQPGTRSGAGWGATSGVIAGGALGALFGIVVAALGDDDDSDAGPIVAFAIGGVAAGALLGGGIGAGIGAMTHGWATLYPLDSAESEDHEPRTRLCVEPGGNFGVKNLQGSGGFSARLGILRRLGERVEMGPVAEYHDIRGITVIESYGGYTYMSETDRLLAVGLDVRVNDEAAGLRPFGSTGVGWCVSEDLYLGGHLGGGLRWRGDHGHEFSVGARRYFSLTGTQARRAQFWAVTAGVTVGL